MDFDLLKFNLKITCETDFDDCKTRIKEVPGGFELFLTAGKGLPMQLRLSWPCRFAGDTMVFGDAWERSYGDLQFLPIGEKRCLPWYFIASIGGESLCVGVKTQPNAFVSFLCEASGVTAIVDCKNGGGGVCLNGREIKLCTFVLKRYSEEDLFRVQCDFCKELCETPPLPVSHKIYGFNNWYYAYGKSSAKQILSDAKLLAALTQGLEDAPYQVVDDGWEINTQCGPWVPNERYPDMGQLAAQITDLGLRPGIWVRFLDNKGSNITKDMRIKRENAYVKLDPTTQSVRQLIAADLEKIKAWGYQLVKHDFSTKDLFGDYGKDLTDSITNIAHWHFHDTGKTNAQIVLDFYRLIKENSGDMLIIGCNTISHLCAGLVHVNRTGDDTSGKDWQRTKTMGINTLAFRLAQNDSFYMVDADCVGICENRIAWGKNKQWLDLLANSNTAFFVSCTDEIDAAVKQDIKNAFLTFQQNHTTRPASLLQGKTPGTWLTDGKLKSYNWQ